MSIVDLENRLTSDYNIFSKLNKSSDSPIFVEGSVHLEDSPSSLELTVGERWFSCNDYSYYTIPEEGFYIKPGAAAVIDTEQIIGVPVNAFGLVTGKGRFIFQGILVSSGKIDPGFYDKLRIGLYNGGREAALLKKGDPFCSVCFFQLESNIDAPRRKLPLIPYLYSTSLSRRKILFRFLKRWSVLITFLLALLSLMVGLYALLPER